MDKARLFVAGAVLIALALLFAVSFNFLDSTGLFGLSQKQGEGQAVSRQAEEKDNGLTAGLSFTVLEPTTLEASVTSGTTLQQCPLETEAEIHVKNSGSSTAEKVFLEFGPGIRVSVCQNCSLEELLPGQEIKAKARLCLESGSLQSLLVGSANSNRLQLLFE